MLRNQATRVPMQLRAYAAVVLDPEERRQGDADRTDTMHRKAEAKWAVGTLIDGTSFLSNDCVQRRRVGLGRRCL